jgi:hypothetical protein
MRVLKCSSLGHTPGERRYSLHFKCSKCSKRARLSSHASHLDLLEQGDLGASCLLKPNKKLSPILNLALATGGFLLLRCLKLIFVQPFVLLHTGARQHNQSSGSVSAHCSSSDSSIASSLDAPLAPAPPPLEDAAAVRWGEAWGERPRECITQVERCFEDTAAALTK